jgi:hypothetical protein
MPNSWNADISRWIEETEEILFETTTAALMKVNEDSITGTPVDTGTARGGWVATVGIPSSSKGAADVNGTNTINKANAVAQDAPGKRYFLTNNIVYIRKLEYGHSRQAPGGMARIAMENIKNALNNR